VVKRGLSEFIIRFQKYGYTSMYKQGYMGEFFCGTVKAYVNEILERTTKLLRDLSIDVPDTS